jgi:hypothetical protein
VQYVVIAALSFPQISAELSKSQYVFLFFVAQGHGLRSAGGFVDKFDSCGFDQLPWQRHVVHQHD